MSTELEDRERVVESTGNIFADLDLPSSEGDMLKVQILHAITVTLKKRKLTQTEAAKIIGLDQAKVSALLRGRAKGFTIDRLIRILTLLGRDIDVNITKTHLDRPGKIRVNAA